MRLNLGCGSVIMPMTEGRKSQMTWWQFLPDTALTADNWVNVDKTEQPGVDEVLDIFKYPWPWASNSVSEIWCSHLVEHIPHEAEVEWPGRDTKLDISAERDGFFAFFYEAWRVLEPDGLIHLIMPYAFSAEAVADPTHRRYMVPASFSYLAPPDESSTFDYQFPGRFEAIKDAVMKVRDPRASSVYGIFGVNIFSDMSVVLRAIKDAD